VGQAGLAKWAILPGLHKGGTPTFGTDPTGTGIGLNWSVNRELHPRGCPGLGRPGPLFPGEPVARKWCLRRELHSHWLVSETSASAVGLTRQPSLPAAQVAKAGGPRGSLALNLRGKNPLLWTLSYRLMVASEGFAPSTSTL
jgi:hypothetical protein